MIEIDEILLFRNLEGVHLFIEAAWKVKDADRIGSTEYVILQRVSHVL